MPSTAPNAPPTSTIIVSTVLEPTHKTQVALLVVVTDFTRIAYLMEVIVHPDHRGRGIGTWCLGTKQAHTLYEKYGFTTIPRPHVMVVKKTLYAPHKNLGSQSFHARYPISVRVLARLTEPRLTKSRPRIKLKSPVCLSDHGG